MMMKAKAGKRYIIATAVAVALGAEKEAIR